MRADRLLSLLMLLQARGRMTAGELAAELEVSERTIYRDIEALSIAGVPVYSEVGRMGGFDLLDSFRTTLTGLTEAEAQALLMLNIPAPLVELGVGAELKAAMLKMAAALPDRQRKAEERMRRRFHLDATWWRQRQTHTPFLAIIHRGVLEDRLLRVTYNPMHAVQIERLVAPYGLVAKAGVWYLVYTSRGAVRARPVSDFMRVHLSQDRFERPADFDLVAFWDAWCEQHENSLRDFAVKLRISPRLRPLLPYYFADQLPEQDYGRVASGEEDWVEMELSFESFEDARTRLLGFGGGAEVLAPPALRQSILDYADQVVALYRGSNSANP